MIGVYKIINRVNGKFYIGSSNNIEHRWKEHKRDLKNNKHHSSHLQYSWNKYGEENFEITILETTSLLEQFSREQYYLDLLTPYDGTIGYNMSSLSIGVIAFGKNNHFYGKHHTDETKLIISKANKGKKLSKEHIAILKELHKGEKHFKAKITNIQAEKIKIRLLNNERIVDITKDYNIIESIIQDIKRCVIWKFVREDLNEQLIANVNKLGTHEEQTIRRNKITKLWNDGISYN